MKTLRIGSLAMLAPLGAPPVSRGAGEQNPAALPTSTHSLPNHIGLDCYAGQASLRLNPVHCKSGPHAIANPRPIRDTRFPLGLGTFEAACVGMLIPSVVNTLRVHSKFGKSKKSWFLDYCVISCPCQLEP